jgi:hypothetical protein
MSIPFCCTNQNLCKEIGPLKSKGFSFVEVTSIISGMESPPGSTANPHMWIPEIGDDPEEAVGVRCRLCGIGALDVPGPRMTSFYLFLGRLSYPLYILHYPLVHVFSNFARSHALHGTQFWLFIAVEMLSAIGFSLVVMKLFDEPMRDRLTRMWRSRRQPVTAFGR